MKNPVIKSERRIMAQASLVIDENNNDIIGYFTLTNKQFVLDKGFSES
ncbi:hypothetical protein [Caldifermentibacillus hisashii]